MIAIHQFSPSAVKGDGIGNGMFYLQKILQNLGFISNIYAEDIEDTLKGRVFSYKKIDRSDKNQILLIHYSIYYNFSTWIDRLECKKIMIYHNITPPEFFKKGTLLYKLCKKGIEYLPELSNRVDGAIGDSPLNSSELIKYGFKNVETIPLLIDTDRILNSDWDRGLYNKIVENFTIIFVGRVAKNKAQHHLIEIANIYAKINPDFKFYIIGGITDYDYYKSLQDLISKYGLEENIILTGKVSDRELYSYYRGANLFLCMSEHEGFGIPLIEAMLFKTPVIAYNSSNIKNTLNGGGVLFNEKSFKYIAGVIELIRTDTTFKRAILETQKEAVKIYKHKNIVYSLVKYLNSMGIEIKEPSIEEREKSIKFQFEGPFDSSYSLAILNRYSALIFNKKYPNRVSLYSTEGGGDFKPNSKFLEKNPEINSMFKLSQKGLNSEVVFRNLYPPRVTGMRGDLNLLNSYGWEESSFPLEFVEQFNSNLDGITVMSNYVKKVLISNGVKVPIQVVGLGVDHILNIKPKPIELNTTKEFKFLHISSAFPRKGVDILLKAYTKTFSSKDNVTLIIKTFPNPHHNIESEIKKIREDKNAPEIILINRDLSDNNIVWLYQNCNALVAPSRGEGFGLPMAEAMLFKLPIITTGFGGQMDFCNRDNSWLIDYSFQKADTHFNLFNSYWAEPDLEDLKKLLKEITLISKSEIKHKTAKAYKLIITQFKWENYRDRSEEFISKLKDIEPFKPKEKLAWVSSYNSKCGIATYSDFLIKNLDRFNISIFANYTKEPLNSKIEDTITRCWSSRFDIDNRDLITSILNCNPSKVLINFNFGFFSTQNLADIIINLKKQNIKIYIIFHSVADITIKGLEASLKDIKDTLELVDRLIIHSINDLNFFKTLGLVNNITLLPHGVLYRENSPNLNDIKRVSSYGFLLPHKGILELIEAFAILKREFKDLELLLVNSIYPIKESQEYFNICKQRIKELGLTNSVKFESRFLEDRESFKLLDSSDLIILPYRKTQESASGAVRYALSTLKPVLCTPQSIFSDIEDIVHFSKGDSPKELANSIRELILDKNLLYSKIDRQKRWVIEHSWENIAKRLEAILDRF